jgi:hypothetical protein
MNAGRRPISIGNLVMRAGKQVWWHRVKEPSIATDLENDLHAYVEELKSNAVAHISSVRLNEGEIYEMVFRTADCPRFIATHAVQPVEARSLYIEDVQGRRYPVRHSAKHLKTLFMAWDPNAA